VNLFRSETQRFAARRAFRWAIPFVLVVIALAAFTTASHSKMHTANFSGQSCTVFNGVEHCNTFVQGQQLDNRYNLERSLADGLSGSGIGFVLVAVILGATFIGGDYAAGSLAGQLGFEPRRGRLYTMKTVAVAVMIGAMTVALLIVLSAALALVASTRGVIGHLTAGWYARRAAEIARVATVSAVAGAMGFAFTSAVRRTAAAVTGFLALTFIVEPALTDNFHALRGLTPAFALLATTVDRFSSGGGFAGFRTLGHSALVLAIWTVGLFLVCGRVFQHREVR
jgi:hypothetical protein